MKEKELLRWSEQRRKGLRKFILLNGVLSWGLPMLIAMAFIGKPFEQGFTAKAITIHCLVWVFGGVLFGIVLWFINEWRYKKQMSKNAA
ncbi:hypothetical protein [Rheinheimera sp. NSM]|uniref:hypothetical protein n=1 Tax=Rheinheimera sp. NSM TaxID=3457884 RepID=UPI0040353992